jgi:kynurenine formamidase
MLIDLTLKVSEEYLKKASLNESMVSFGHMGTHFDVMNKEFPLRFAKLKGMAFDVSSQEGDIRLDDALLSLIKPDSFIIFHTGFMDKEPYGTAVYFKEHPQLSDGLIEKLLDRDISIIGIDCAGIKRPDRHTQTDQYCADRGLFIVENLANLKGLISEREYSEFTIYTFPVNFEGLSGLPCRVMAEL